MYTEILRLQQYRVAEWADPGEQGAISALYYLLVPLPPDRPCNYLGCRTYLGITSITTP